MKTTENCVTLWKYIIHWQCQEHRFVWHLCSVKLASWCHRLTAFLGEIVIMGCNWLHLFTFNNREWLRCLTFLILNPWTRRFVNRLPRDTQGQHMNIPPFKLKAVLPAQENSYLMKTLLIWVLFLKQISSKMQYRSLDSILPLQLLWMQHQDGFGCGCEPAWFTWVAQQVVPLSGSACELHAWGGICLITSHVTDNQVVDAWSHAPKLLVS